MVVTNSEATVAILEETYANVEDVIAELEAFNANSKMYVDR